MTLEGAGALALEGIPDDAVEVIVTGEEEAARGGEGDGADTAEDALVGVGHELTVGTDIEETAGGIVGAGTEGVAVGEEVDGVDIALVALEGLCALVGTDIPVLGGGVASARDEGVLVGRDGDAHHVAAVVLELGDLGAGLDIPEDAGHITGAGEDLLVAEEADAADVAGVGDELAAHADGDVAGAEVVHGADVVETTAGDERAGGGVAAGHNPGGAEGDGVDLVGAETVPHEKLAVLGGGHEVVAVGRPVHGVDLGQVTLQGTAHLDLIGVGCNGDVTSHVLD